MSRAKVQSFGRGLVSDPITRALAISLMLHFIGIGGVELGRRAGWWEHSLLPSFMQKKLMAEVAKTAEERADLQKQMLRQQPPPEAELVFIDIDPSQSQPEPPKDAKYYSSHNTVASNPSKDPNKTVPKIDGTQEKVPKTTDTPRPAPKPVEPMPEPERPKVEVMKPALPPQKTPEPPEQEQEPKPEPVPKGETLMAKATIPERPQLQENNPTPPVTPRKRPKTLEEAKAQKGILEGPKMRQEGGVNRLGLVSNMDVKATPFGTYDALFIQAVQTRWFSLLDERDFVGNQSGKVVVEFRLHQDGRVTNMSVVDASVTELLSWFCQRAVLDPAPYRPFPPDLRRMMNADYREIRFTFYYNQ